MFCHNPSKHAAFFHDNARKLHLEILPGDNHDLDPGLVQYFLKQITSHPIEFDFGDESIEDALDQLEQESKPAKKQEAKSKQEKPKDEKAEKSKKEKKEAEPAEVKAPAQSDPLAILKIAGISQEEFDALSPEDQDELKKHIEESQG